MPSAPTRVDFHVKVLDESVAARAKARELDAIVYAPHFTRLPTIHDRAAAFSDDDLVVLPGREVFTGTWRNRKHLLAVGLSEPIPDFITLDGAMAELERQGAVVLVPHPAYLTVSLEAADVRAHLDHIHALEVDNPKMAPWHRRRAVALAEAVDRPPFGSSYAHLRGTVGEVWTAFPGVPPTERGVLDALRTSAPRSVHRRHGVAHGVQSLAEVAHLAYENSWQKFVRVVGTGLEPTHPAQSAYGGRFDDVRVDQRSASR